MNPSSPPFTVELTPFEPARAALYQVREQVFVREQGVPPELERDEADRECVHVIARDASGEVVGTGRITAGGRIGRMAVLREWRGRGVGDVMLQALLDHARERGLAEAQLPAQASAIGFYAGRGFSPTGERFQEAGIEHQAMRFPLLRAGAVETRDAAIAATAAVVAGARSRVWIHSRELDPGLLDAEPVLEALRAFAVGGRGREARIILHDPAAPQRAHAPLLGLAQRLPSVFQFRAVDDPVDHAYSSAFLANDSGGYYFRRLGHRFDGEWDPSDPGRARQLAEAFKPVWERARACSELRARGL